MYIYIKKYFILKERRPPLRLDNIYTCVCIINFGRVRYFFFFFDFFFFFLMGSGWEII